MLSTIEKVSGRNRQTRSWYGMIYAHAEARQMRKGYLGVGHIASKAAELALQWLSRQKMIDY